MKTLAEALEHVKSLPAAAKAELDKLLAGPKWVPQPGPQSMAYDSRADIVFYGGAAGGGKTDLLLGLCLTAADHSIIFRREAVQLTGIEERMSNILGNREGYNSQKGVWRLPGGRVMELGSVKEPDDWMKYQGRAHDHKCVGRGTPVKMADGTYKAIEAIEVGDLVATLEGARKVTRTFRMVKPAVLATAVHGNGVMAQQVQSAQHQILFANGWQSAEQRPDLCGPTPRHACGKSASPLLSKAQSLCRHLQRFWSGLSRKPVQPEHLGRPHPAGDLGSLTCRVACEPTQHHCACKSAGSSFETCAAPGSTPSAKSKGLAPLAAPHQSRLDRQSRSGFFAGVAGQALGSGCAAFAYRLSVGVQRFSGCALQALAQPFLWLSAPGSALPFAAHGAIGVLAGSSPASCLGGCSSAPRHGGGQPRAAQVGAPGCLLLSADAGPQTPTHSGADAQGKTPTHSPRTRSYSHPYTKESRQTTAALSEASLHFSDAGVQELFDLTVDEVNHYITAGGFINRNCFDEITHFTEGQFRTLIGWMRTDNPDIRQRVVCAGNPPTTAEGEWVKRFWAAWLDPNHPNRAQPGELRWYVTDEKGEDREVPGPEPVLVGNEYMTPKSRTFIPSSVDDNLFLLTTGYKATLQSLPEPLRSQMLKGDFNAGAADPAWQTIPTEWVKAAQARWKPRTVKGPMTVLGLDPARGGMDKTTAAPRHGQWFDNLVTAPGVVTKDGPTTAAFVAPLIRNGAPVAVDAIGIGSSALDFIKGLNLRVHAVVGSERSDHMDRVGQLRFRNVRAEMYWRLREALDPTNPDPIALPPDAELLADLCAVRYKVVTMGQSAAVQMREKDEIREALGRSPDKGDAVAMTFAEGIPKPIAGKKKATWRDRLKLKNRTNGSAQAA